MTILHLELSAHRAKRVAKLLANDTARRVMDALTDESKSETQLAQELSLPLSTVHYNVQQLLKEGLLLTDEFTYSEKGREVRYYRLASDHVLITTRPVGSLPAILTGSTLALLLAVSTYFLRQPDVQLKDARVMVESSAMMADAAAPVASTPQVWPWILLGALAVIVGILVVQFILRRRP